MKLTQEINKNLEKMSFYSKEDLLKDCKCYIKALKAGRVQFRVTHVSKSGMSRNIFIQSFEGKMTKGYYRTYSNMLKALGFSIVKNSNDIRVSGCGMNMLFSTNYEIMYSFLSMGIIKKRTCKILSQKIH